MRAPSQLFPSRARSRRVALLLALCALLITILLTGWHDGKPHLDVAGGTEYLVHPGDHHPEDQPNPADPIHVAAHVVLQGVALPGGLVIAPAIMVKRLGWVRLAIPSRTFSTTDSILRPPRP